MVYTHNEILHAGSINTSGQVRYFISAYFQRFGLPHRDNFRHPLVEAIKTDARARNDRRVLRLFAEDDQLEERERAVWAQMIAEDRAALAEGEARLHKPYAGGDIYCNYVKSAVLPIDVVAR